MIRIIHQTAIGGLGMLISFNVQKFLPVETVRIIEASNSSRLERAHGVERFLNISKDVTGVLDINSDVVRCTSDQLGLIGQPIDIDLLLIALILVLLYHHMSRPEPANFYQVGLSGIAPEPYLLTHLILRVHALVLRA